MDLRFRTQDEVYGFFRQKVNAARSIRNSEILSDFFFLLEYLPKSFAFFLSELLIHIMQRGQHTNLLPLFRLPPARSLCNLQTQLIHDGVEGFVRYLGHIATFLHAFEECSKRRIDRGGSFIIRITHVAMDADSSVEKQLHASRMRLLRHTASPYLISLAGEYISVRDIQRNANVYRAIGNFTSEEGGTMMTQ